MMFGDGYGLSRPDLYVTSLIDKLHGWQLRANELSETTKYVTTLGVYIKKYFGSRYYGKAMNVTRRLVEAYDAVLKDYDLLLMPTMPMKPTPLPPADAPRELYVQRALEMIGNTAPFDITHHPAMTVAVRHGRRPADRTDADRQAFRRIDDLSRGLRVRAGGRLEEDVEGRAEANNPRWVRMDGSAGASVTKAMMRISPPHSAQRRGKIS